MASQGGNKMSKNLKSLLRAEVNPAKANATKVWDIERQRVCAANDKPNPLVIWCSVRDGLLYESFYLREGNEMILKGITAYDKLHTQMQTIRLEDKIRFSVREFDFDNWHWCTTPRRYANDIQKNISIDYLGEKRNFKERCADKRAEINKAKRKAKADKAFQSLKPLTEDMKVWAREDIMGKHYSLLYDAKTRQAECGRCGKTMILPKSHAHHKQIGKCPVCGKEVTYRSKGKFAYYYGYNSEVTFMEKLDNGNVVVRYYTASLSLWSNCRTEFNLYEIAREVINFADSKIELWKESNGVWHKVNRKLYAMAYTNWFGKSWYQTWGNLGRTYQGNLKEVIDTTPLKYSCVEKYADYKNEYITSVFTNYVRIWLKNPALEWILKCGFNQVAKEILCEDSCLRVLPMKRDGKTLAEVFHLNRQQWKALLPYAKDVSYRTIVMCAAHPEQKVESIVEFANKIKAASVSDLNTILEFTTVHKAIKYCESNNFSTWRDYIRMSKDDGSFDVTSSQIVFPRNLEEVHRHQIQVRREKEVSMIKAEHRALLDAVTEMATKMHNMFDFHQGKLLMTVPETGDEIVDEGHIQNICVGSFDMPYIRNMASGLGFILFVRDENEPSKPFYTVEVRDGKILQVRGKYNCDPTVEVKSFIKAFAQAKQLVCNY